MHRWTRTFTVLLVSIIGSSVSSADEQAAVTRERGDELSEQLIGWFEDNKGRRLTILPNKGTLVAVFDWANGAPTSVGEIVVTDGGMVEFKQPAASEDLSVEQDDGQIKAVSVVDVRFAKLAGLEQALGDYADEQAQTLKLSVRNSDIYCSIAWRNNAPKTNGWLRAAPNGKTALEGFKWREEVSFDFDDGSVRAISIIGKKFNRVREPLRALQQERRNSP